MICVLCILSSLFYVTLIKNIGSKASTRNCKLGLRDYKISKIRMVCESLRWGFGRGDILKVTRPNSECCQNSVSNIGLNIFVYIIGSNAVSIVLKMTLDQVSDSFLVLSNSHYSPISR